MLLVESLLWILWGLYCGAWRWESFRFSESFGLRCTRRYCREWRRLRTCSSAVRCDIPPSGPKRCSCSHPSKLKRLNDKNINSIHLHSTNKRRHTNLDNRLRCLAWQLQHGREFDWWTATKLPCETCRWAVEIPWEDDGLWRLFVCKRKNFWTARGLSTSHPFDPARYWI